MRSNCGYLEEITNVLKIVGYGISSLHEKYLQNVGEYKEILDFSNMVLTILSDDIA